MAIPVFTDGVSLMPALTQGKSAQSGIHYLYGEYAVGGQTPSYPDFETSKQGRTRGQMQFIRIGDYKGVRYDIKEHDTSPFEIYNVVTDERESINLGSSMPELQKQMMDKVLQVRKPSDKAPRPYDTEFIPSVTLSNPKNGLRKKIFSGKHDWVPNFDLLEAKKTSVVKGIDLKTNGLTSQFGLSYSGFIKIPEDGAYTIYLESASNCHVMLHDIHLLDNDFKYSPKEQAEKVYLKAGYHPIRIFYQQNGNVVPSISLKMEGSGLQKRAISNSVFFIEKDL